jgi:hypothetical protein
LRPGPTGRLFLSCSSWPVLISVWFNLNGQCGPNPRATVLFPAMRARCGSFGTLARAIAAATARTCLALHALLD